MMHQTPGTDGQKVIAFKQLHTRTSCTLLRVQGLEMQIVASAKLSDMHIDPVC